MEAAPLEASLWYATARPAPVTPGLEGAARVDVCVIGAGYTGLSTALHLAERGINVAVLESREIGYGGSGRNAGHCTPTFHFHDLPKIRKLLGEPWASRLIEKQCDAAKQVFALIWRHDIDCEAVQSGYVHAAHRPEMLVKLAAKRDAYNALGKRTRLLNANETEKLTGATCYHGAWFHPEGGHLNPLGYARGLADAAIGRGARVFTRSPVTAIVPAGRCWRVDTPSGHILADKVVCATGAYTDDYWRGLRDSFTQLRVAVMASEPLSANLRKTVLPADTTLVDTRGDPLVLKLDRDGRLVTSVFVEGRRGGDPARTTAIRNGDLRQLWPQLGELDWAYYWYGELDMQPLTVPRLFHLAPGVVASLGYSGRGVPTGTMMGSVLADWATGVPESDLALRLEPLRRAPAYMHLAPRAYLALARWRDPGGKPPNYSADAAKDMP